jgi:predicted MFS family arabinose efflux permease
MFPLTVQYAPLQHRATMTSIMMSGLVLGITVARLIGGVVSQFVPWRITYWISFGLQLAFLLLLLLFMPDYPISRPGTSYIQSLWTLVKLPFQHPVLTQQSLIAFLTMGTFTCFWTTLTFQLTDQFGYNTLKIGLFSLIAFGPVILNPIVSQFVAKHLHPTATLIIAHIVGMAATCIGTFVGDFSIGGLVVRAFLGDLGMNTAVVANRMAIANVNPQAQNAVNSVYMVFTFCGQMSGTAAGNKLYAQGGWDLRVRRVMKVVDEKGGESPSGESESDGDVKTGSETPKYAERRDLEDEIREKGVMV